MSKLVYCLHSLKSQRYIKIALVSWWWRWFSSISLLGSVIQRYSKYGYWFLLVKKELVVMNFHDCMWKGLSRSPNTKTLRIILDNESSFLHGNAVKSCQASWWIDWENVLLTNNKLALDQVSSYLHVLGPSFYDICKYCPITDNQELYQRKMFYILSQVNSRPLQVPFSLHLRIWDPDPT